MNSRALFWLGLIVLALAAILAVTIVCNFFDCTIVLYFGKFLYPLNQIVGVCINRAAFSFLLFR